MNRRFFVDKIFSEKSSLHIRKPEYTNELQHIRKVLRLQEGDTVLLLNGEGQEATALIRSLQPEQAELCIQSVQRLSAPQTEIWIAQGLLKGQRMDWLMEKYTEVGIQKIFPLITRFASISERESKRRMERWQRILIAALKQSGSGFLPKIQTTTTIQDLLGQIPHDAHKIYLHRDLQTPPLLQELTQIANTTQDPPKVLCFFIGPEGGFHAEEVLQLNQAGCIPASLGESILRGETAGLATAIVTQQWILACRK